MENVPALVHCKSMKDGKPIAKAEHTLRGDSEDKASSSADLTSVIGLLSASVHNVPREKGGMFKHMYAVVATVSE